MLVNMKWVQQMGYKVNVSSFTSSLWFQICWVKRLSAQILITQCLMDRRGHPKMSTFIENGQINFTLTLQIIKAKKINTLFPVTCLRKSRPETRDYFFIDKFFHLGSIKIQHVLRKTCTWFAKQFYLEVLYEIISNHHIDENQFLHTNPRKNPTLNIY